MERADWKCELRTSRRPYCKCVSEGWGKRGTGFTYGESPHEEEDGDEDDVESIREADLEQGIEEPSHATSE